MASPDDPPTLDAEASIDGPKPADGPAGAPVDRVPVTSPGRGLAAVGAVVAVVLVLAVAKPWTWGVSQAPARQAAVLTLPPAAAPSPTFDASPEHLAAAVCLGTDAWRVASLETWRISNRLGSRSQAVRVWRAIDPVTGPVAPDDPRIPIVGVAATQVDAIGWCAPQTGPERPSGPVDVTVWRLDGVSATRVKIRRVAPVAGETPLAALYREVSDCVSDYGCSGAGVPLLAPGWTTARYVFQYADPGASRTWWFGADVVVLPGPATEATEAVPSP